MIPQDFQFWLRALGPIAPPVVLRAFTCEEVVVARGHLPFTSAVYRSYNDALRYLGADCGLRVADIDLVKRWVDPVIPAMDRQQPPDGHGARRIPCS